MARAQVSYDAMERSLRKLAAAGIPIVLGTDDGAVRDHFYAFTAHRELMLFAHAGLKPAEILDIATRRTADFLRLADLGTLAAGKRADFVVLAANPLADIANTEEDRRRLRARGGDRSRRARVGLAIRRTAETARSLRIVFLCGAGDVPGFFLYVRYTAACSPHALGRSSR